MRENRFRTSIFGIPTVLWLVLPIPFVLCSIFLLQKWPPAKIAEPPDRAEIFHEPVLVVRDGSSFKFIKFEERDDAKPTWAINTNVYEDFRADWNAQSLIPTLERLHSKWQYELTAQRFDKNAPTNFANPDELTQTALDKLRPKVVAMLDERSKGRQDGKRLERLLDKGLEESTYSCPQNGLVILCWFSIAMAIYSLLYLLFGGAFTSRSGVNMSVE